MAESVFERRRARTEPLLLALIPDAAQRLNSIEQNLAGDNAEDWKNAVVSCRTLIVDVANVVAPASKAEDKPRYLNRLKGFVDEAAGSSTRGKLLKTYLDEAKARVEYISNLAQGAAHSDRPTKEYAEDTVLVTYLVIGDILALVPESVVPVVDVVDASADTGGNLA